MTHVIDEKQKRSLLDRILASEIFAHSQVYQDGERVDGIISIGPYAICTDQCPSEDKPDGKPF